MTMHRIKILIIQAMISFAALFIALSSYSSSPFAWSTLEPNCVDITNKSLKRKRPFKSDERESVRNQALVKFKTGVSRENIEKIAQELDLKIIKVMSSPHVYLMEASPNTTVEEIVKRLSLYEQVEYCEPNYIYRIPKE